ncbi:MAG: TonB-dependent receptor [Burkholderiales bacterium]|nr:TonB-dependent receptor [Burkholderiales bacterium]
MEQVVVVSQRVTAGLARAAQQDAENIVNVLGGAEIRKLPVVNAGDAVRRIPGVQLETDTGEGRFVNIRGLDSDLSSTTFGGVRLPPTDVTTSPYGGSRAVSFDNIPAAMIGSITVTKTNRPEQEAEAVGGTIEITPKTVPRGGKPFFADVKLGSGYEPLRGTGIVDLALTVGGRFGAASKADPAAGDVPARAPFSLIGVFSYYADKRGVDDLEGSYLAPAPGIPYKALQTFEQRYYRQQKKRHVVGGEFGYSPSPAHHFYLRYYDFGATQHYNRNGLLYTFPGNPVVQPDGSVTESGVSAQKYYRSNKESFDTRLLSVGGKDRYDRFAIDYFLAHTIGSYKKPFDQIPVWTQAGTPTVTYNNTVNANDPSLSVAGANPFDPAGYAFTGFSNSTQNSTTQDWSAKLNVTVPTQFTSYETEQVKFGVGARRRRFSQDVSVYNATQLPVLPLTQAVAGPGVTYYDGHYAMGPLIEPGAVQAAFAAGTGFANDPVADAATAAQSTYAVHEDVYALYGQYQSGYGKLGVFTGARIEATRTQFDAFNVNSNSSIVPTSSRHSYTDLLPSLQLRYEFTPTLLGRAIYSSTIGRPGYNQQSPALNINLPANLVSQGNPDIRPLHSHNLDFSIENYLPGGGILSAGFFYKDLKDYIVPLVTTQTYPNQGLFAGFTGPVSVITFKNGAPARITGVEFEYAQRFRGLPGWLQGLGTTVNWTGTSSRIEIRPGETTALPSTARTTANAILSYERRDAYDLELGANYISRNLFAIGGDAASDVYSEARFSLDFGSRYHLSKTFSVYFNAKNLTNTPLKFTLGSSDRPIQRETYGRTFQFGVLGHF